MKKIFTIILIIFSLLLSVLSINAQVQHLCGNDTLILHLNNYQYGAIQWEESEDSVGWKIIDGAIDTVYKFYPDGNKYYRAGITLALCPIIYSEIFKVSMPVAANAGSDIRTSIPTTMLSANKPNGCSGQWKIINGTCGTLEDSTNNLSKFTGQIGQNYTLVWALTNICGATTDTMTIAMIQNVYRNNIVYVDSTDIILSDSSERAKGNLTIKFSSPVPTVTDSTVLIFLTQDKLLLKVQTVTTNSDTVIMTTTQGALEDFMVNGVIDFSPFNYQQSTLKSDVENKIPSRQDLINNKFVNGQILFFKQTSTDTTLKISRLKGLKAGTNNNNTLSVSINPIEIYHNGNVTLQISGNIDFTPNLVSFVEIKWWGLDTMILKLDNAVLDYTLVPEIIINGSCNVVNFDKEWKLYEQDVLVMAGGVPVWISAEVSVKALFTINANGTVDVKLNYNYNREYNAGIYYGQHDKKFKTFYSSSAPRKTIKPEFTGKVSLESEFKFGPKFQLQLYKGLTGNIEFYALKDNFNACINNQLDWNADIDLSSELVIGGYLEIANKKFYEKDLTKTLTFEGFRDEFPNRISKESGDMQTGTLGKGLINPVKVKVQSDWYMPMPFVNVYFEPLNGSVQNTKVTTDVNGNAETNWTLDNTSGTQYLNAYVKDCNSDVINSKIAFTAYADVVKGCETSTLDLTLKVDKAKNTIKPIATRGALPYKYSTDGSTYQNTIPVQTLTNGTNYSFYVKDANGCIKLKSFKNSLDPCANVHITPTISIDSRQKAITVTPKGGTAPYQYSYISSTTFTSDSTYTFSTSGAYTVYVIDANACQANTSILIPANKDSFGTGIIFNPNLSYGSMSDIDGNSYKTIVIGSQTWMAQNLRTTKYNDGTVIPNLKDSAAWSNDTLGAFCTYNNTTNIDTINTYGRLYNFLSLSFSNGKLCPSGWHVPGEGEWTILSNTLGYDAISGDALKEFGATHWNYTNSGDNSSGFSALPGGYCYIDGTIGGIEEQGVWWEADGTREHSWGRQLLCYSPRLNRNGYGGGWGLSVRCLKDN